VRRLVAGLERLARRLADTHETEFVLVDDGSTDRTWEVLQREFGGRTDCKLVRHAHNRGIAAAIATGISHASAETVASIDADCTYDPEQLAQMLPLLTPNVDLVVASPYHPRGSVQNVPRWRLAISRAASRMYALVLRNQLHTYTSCFRVYRRSAVCELPLSNNGFVGIVELVWHLDIRGSTIAECPAALTVRRTGQSKLKLVRVTLGHLQLIGRAFCYRAAELLGRGRHSPTGPAYPASAPALATSDVCEETLA
jgi:dolichol-phosphate mannosyltransferase